MELQRLLFIHVICFGGGQPLFFHEWKKIGFCNRDVFVFIQITTYIYQKQTSTILPYSNFKKRSPAHIDMMDRGKRVRLSNDRPVPLRLPRGLLIMNIQLGTPYGRV